MFRQLLIGVLNIHSRNVIHTDLKPENILLDSSYSVAIADFGMSYILEEWQDGSIINGRGTVTYMSPENLATRDHASPFCGFKADIWSLGCILFVMLMGVCPFGEEGPIPTDWFLKRLRLGRQDKFWSGHEMHCTRRISKEAKAFIAGMLSFDPRERPCVADLLNDPWLQSDEMPLSEARTTLRLMNEDIKRLSCKSRIDADIKGPPTKHRRS